MELKDSIRTQTANSQVPSILSVYTQRCGCDISVNRSW